MAATASEKPLEYESLKAVIAHMSFAKRLEISKRCPSVRGIEKRIPLKIGRLKLGNHEVKVNEVEYKLTIHYPEDYIPVSIKMNIDTEGVSHDLNQYGIQDFTTEYVTTPGDVLLKDNGFRDDREAQKLEEYEEIERRTHCAQIKGKSNMHHFSGGRATKIHHSLNGRCMLTYPKMLKPYWCRQKSVPFPHKFYIRFTKTDGDGTKYTEILEYSKKLHETSKYLIHTFFGGRNSHIKVNTIMIHRSEPIMVLRLPENVKFKTAGQVEFREKRPMRKPQEAFRKFIEF